MKFSKTLSKAIIAFASLCTIAQPVLAQSSEVYKTRVPLTVSAINPNLTVINMGAAPVGVTQVANAYYTNSTGVDVQLNAASFSVSGGAQMLSTTCSGTVLAGSSCGVTVGLAVGQTGPVSGTISVATGNPAGPDAIVINATGLAGAPGLVSTPTTVDFGNQGVNGGAGPVRNITISNTGDASAVISNVVSPSIHYLVDAAGCRLVLVPGDSCNVAVRFAPRSLGVINTNLRVTLSNGTVIPLTALTGSGVQGIPRWTVPSTFQFYDLNVGVRSPGRTVTMTNTGLGNMNLVSLQVQGDLSFRLDSTTCPLGGPLVPGASCTATVSALVTDSSSHAANLVLASTQSSVPSARVPLTARALYSEAIAFPSSLDFGEVPAGQTVAQSVTLHNPGTLPLTITDISANAPFTVSGDCTAVLSPLSSCTLTVSITSGTAGPVTGQVTILTDATVNGNPSIDLSAEVVGSGAVTAFDVSASSLYYGGVSVGQDRSLTLAVLNTGTEILTLDSIASTGAYSATHNCTSIAAGDSCDVTITFTPVAAGSAVGTLNLSAAGVVRSVALSGIGLTAVLTTNVSQLDFGSVVIGGTATQPITLTNQGTAPASLGTAITATGYSITSNTCGAVLAAGATCVMEVAFAPTAARPYAETLTIQGGTAGPVTVPLLGTGTVPLVTSYDLSPSTADFGALPVGESRTLNVAVLNTGTTNLTLGTPTSDSTEYSAVHNCYGTIPGAICMVNLTYAATVAGPSTGTLTLSDGGSAIRTIAMTGTGTRASLTMGVTNLDFGDVIVFQSSSRPLVVANTGTQEATLGFDLAAPYSLGASNCPLTLAPAASCEVTVVFTPTLVQAYPSALQVSGSFDGQKTVNLTGTGIPVPLPVSSWDVSSNTLNFGTVPNGSSTTQVIQILNNGETNLPAFVAVVAGNGYTVANGCVAVSLAVGQSCNVVVTFNPTQAGQAYPATLTISQGATSVDVALNGNVADVATVALEGDTDFETYSFSSGFNAPIPRVFTVRNDSVSTTLTGLSFNIGTNSSQTFYRTATTCSTLAPGASCSVTIAFRPSAIGLFTQTLTVTSTQSATASQSLSGRGGSPVWDISPQTIDLGTIVQGSFTTKQVLLRNTGAFGSPVIPSVSSSSNNPAFTADTSNCVNLPAGSSCVVEITYSPSSEGPTTGVLSFTHGGITRTVTASGDSGSIQFESNFVDFDGVMMGSVFAVPVTFTNTGTLPARVTTAISPAGVLGMALNEQELPGCLLVQPGDTCSSIVNIRVTEDFFMAEIEMTAHYSDSVSGQATSSPQAPFIILGTAYSAVTIGPQTLGFGDVTIGNTLTLPVTIANQTNQPLDVSSLTLSGAAEFRAAHNCVNVPAGGTCTVNVTLAPTSVAAFSGSLQVALSNGETPTTIALAGYGVPGRLLQVSYQSSPIGSTFYNGVPLSNDGLLNVGDLVTGRTHSVAPVALTLTNVSNLTLSLAPSSTPDIRATLASTTCGISLAPGASCVRNVYVGTGSLSANSAQVNVAYNTPSGARVTGQVPLFFQATPAYSISGASFGTLSPGQSVSRTITLTNHTPYSTTMTLHRPSSSFSISGYTGSCASGTTMAANSSCTFQLTFTPTTPDFNSLSYGQLMFMGTYHEASASVYAQTYTPPPPPVSGGTSGGGGSGSAYPVLRVQVVTNRQVNAVAYGDQGHYFSSYSGSCSSGGYAQRDSCMLAETAASYTAVYGPHVSCYGVTFSGPYPYFASWGYQCSN